MARRRWTLVPAVVVVLALLGGCGSDDDGATSPGTSTGPDATASPDPTPVPASVSSQVEFRPVLLQPRLEPGTTSLCEPGDPSAIDASEPISADQCVDGVVTATYELGPSLLGGSAIESAEASLGQNGQWIVNPVFFAGPAGIDAFNAAAATCHAMAATCPTGELAIVVDGQVVSAPSINEAIFSRDQIQISGTFTERSARDLAERLSLD
jgi:preprotein translocase subunit SecD